MGSVLSRAIDWFADIFIFLLLIRTFLSWMVLSGNKQTANLYEILLSLTEPIVAPCRKLLERLNMDSGMIDWSILLAFFVIRVIASVLMQIVLVIF